MDKISKPDKLDTDPNTAGSELTFKHWIWTFNNYVGELLKIDENFDKFKVLEHHVSLSVFSYIEDSTPFDNAVTQLNKLFVKTKGEVFARNNLATRRQQPGESLEEFLQILRLLAKDCQLKSVSAEKNRDDCIRDSFIRGLQSGAIRQRLLEDEASLDLEAAFTKARSLEMAHRNSSLYDGGAVTVASA